MLWFAFGYVSVKFWLCFGLILVPFWFVFGFVLVYVWFCFGYCSDSISLSQLSGNQYILILLFMDALTVFITVEVLRVSFAKRERN